jgi:NAD(P)-dependent dehydrogenase (short-subunit alcohol dehydrogenase family)
MRLAQRVAIVTGAGSGIGQAIAELFAQEGAKVVIAEVDRAKAEITQQAIQQAGREAMVVETDVSREASVAAMVARSLERYGAIDILVNNAAIAAGNDVLGCDEATWDYNLAVGLKGTFLCARAVLPGMIAQKRGAIVNISSVNGLVALGEPAYSASKAGIINLTKNMAVSYGQYQIRVNAICPGTVRTPVWKPMLEKDPHIFDRLAKWYPLGRVGEPGDIAKAALFLASDDAAWITGETLTVDGGLMAGSYRMTRELEGNLPE